jgi:uncharacterized protein (DUF1778 family)
MTNDERVAIRMPGELRQWIEQEAERDGRTVSNFIVFVLRKAREDSTLVTTDDRSETGRRVPARATR